MTTGPKDIFIHDRPDWPRGGRLSGSLEIAKYPQRLLERRKLTNSDIPPGRLILATGQPSVKKLRTDERWLRQAGLRQV